MSSGMRLPFGETEADDFVDRVDEVSRLIEGLKDGTLPAEYVDQRESEIVEREEKREASRKKEEEEEESRRFDKLPKERQEELLLRRECREMLELSTQQLEEMQEKKGEFGNEYRVVTAAWYMMMLPDTDLRSHLMAPHDASKIAWQFQEREYERRRVEGGGPALSDRE